MRLYLCRLGCWVCAARGVEAMAQYFCVEKGLPTSSTSSLLGAGAERARLDSGAARPRLLREAARRGRVNVKG